MKSKIKVQFDSAMFRGDKPEWWNMRIIIENPPYFPRIGDVFDCEWEEYITDHTVLKMLKEFDEDDCWIVSFVFSKYSKKEFMYEVVLMEAVDYEKSLKK